MITKLPSSYYYTVRGDTLGALSQMVSCSVLPSQWETLTGETPVKSASYVIYPPEQAGPADRWPPHRLHGAERQLNGHLITNIKGP